MNNEMTGFDDFLLQDDGQEIDSLSTEYVPLPAGRLTARVDKIEGKTWPATETRPARRSLNVKYVVNRDNLPEVFQEGDKEIALYDTIWLDYDSQGRLATGLNANLQLARFRHATNTNSPMTLVQVVQRSFGVNVIIDVTQEQDKRDSTRIRNNIRAVLPLE